MVRRVWAPIAAALIIAAAPPQNKPAATPSTKATPAPTTLNCLLASNVFAQRETDPQRKQLAHESLIYYLGRLDAHTSAPQLASALKQTAVALIGVNAASLMNECVVELRTKASTFDTAVRQLQPQQQQRK